MSRSLVVPRDYKVTNSTNKWEQKESSYPGPIAPRGFCSPLVSGRCTARCRDPPVGPFCTQCPRTAGWAPPGCEWAAGSAGTQTWPAGTERGPVGVPLLRGAAGGGRSTARKGNHNLWNVIVATWRRTFILGRMMYKCSLCFGLKTNRMDGYSFSE